MSKFTNNLTEIPLKDAFMWIVIGTITTAVGYLLFMVGMPSYDFIELFGFSAYTSRLLMAYGVMMVFTVFGSIVIMYGWYLIISRWINKEKA